MGKYFGTDGFRGVAGKDLNATVAFKIGRFLGQFPNGKKNKVLIARDTRLSGPMLSSSLMAGLNSSGSTTVDIGISTTPSVSYLVEHGDFDYGIMISASHNPYYDNGIKIFNSQGEKANGSFEIEIENYLDSSKDSLPEKSGKDIGNSFQDNLILNQYLDFLYSKKTEDFSNIRILVDGAYGSASRLVRILFARCQIKADFINVEPNGTNINDLCGSTHIGRLSSLVKKGHYDLALAFDGDADRLMAMDANGKVVDGDAMLYLAALDLKSRNELKDNKVVLTVMSNYGLFKAFERNGISIESVKVGDKYVQRALKDNGLVLGGEQSGHIIFYKDLNTGDGLLSAIKLLNIIVHNKKPLADLLIDLPIFPQLLKNITVANKDEVLNHPELKKLITKVESELGTTGRLLVRASGTEPLIRVMVEAPTLKTCQLYVQEIVDFINEAFVN